MWLSPWSKSNLNLAKLLYTVEVRNRFKGLDLIDREPDELWTEVRDICTGDRDQDHPQEIEMQKKQNDCLKKP